MTGRRAVEAVGAAVTGRIIRATPETLILRTTALGMNIRTEETVAGKRIRGAEDMGDRTPSRDHHRGASLRGILTMLALHEDTTTEETLIPLRLATSRLLEEGMTGNLSHAGTYTIDERVRS